LTGVGDGGFLFYLVEDGGFGIGGGGAEGHVVYGVHGSGFRDVEGRRLSNEWWEEDVEL